MHAQIYVGRTMEMIGWEYDEQRYGKIIEDSERSQKYYWHGDCGEVSHIIEVTGKCSFEGVCEILDRDGGALDKGFSVTISGKAY